MPGRNDEVKTMTEEIKIPNLNPELLDVDKLIPYVNNAKKHSKHQIQKIKMLILTNGYRFPILL